MKWQGREILPIRHRYNCQINDDVYPPPFGWAGKLLMMVHHAFHNVPVRGFRSSERSIEVPLAFDFIAHEVVDEPLLELGCVLPYYALTRRNHRVFDLTDNHPQCEKRDIRELCQEEYATNIVSISTIEHIDRDEYGIISKGNVSGLDILMRIVENAKRYFVTFPLGCNSELDEYALAEDRTGLSFISRSKGEPNDWNVISRTELTSDMKQYGTYLRANTVCVASSCR